MVMRANVGADLATAEPRALFRAHLDCAARLTAASGFTGREDWPRAAGGS